jgi:hypothetical protein
LPPIPPVILNSIVYLYQDEVLADTGAPEGGSGLLIGMPSEAVKTATHFYAVTNRHVIDDGFPVVRVNLTHPSSLYKRTATFPFEKESWVTHPEHDLAVRALPPDIDPSVYSYSLLGME